MKKKISLFCALFGFLCMLLLLPKETAAQDVWFYSEYGTDVYFRSESIKAGAFHNMNPQYPDKRDNLFVTVGIKRVNHATGKLLGNVHDSTSCGFAEKGSRLYGYEFSRSSGSWEGPTLVAGSDFYSALYSGITPYFSQAGVQYSDSWY